jgi:hypothetical protein
MASLSRDIRVIIRYGILASISAIVMVTIPFDKGCAEESQPSSPVKEILFGGGFIVPIHPEEYADAATGIGVRAEAGLGFYISKYVAFYSRIGIGYMPAGYKIEPEFLEICSDQYTFESIVFLHGMGDLRIYLLPDENHQIRPFILSGAGVLNARQKTTFTTRDMENFRCIILDEREEKISKWSFAANGGFGMQISIEDVPFQLIFQSRYMWVKDAIFDNMQNIVVEMAAVIHL